MVGTRVSHYLVVDKLGEGGMGTVYKAQDLRLERFVALKFLSSRLLISPEARARFEQEAKLISALSHPNIATIYEVDELDGVPFLVLEYLGGGTLTRKVTSRRLPLEEIVRDAMAIGAGLAHAHQRGVVHRDIKTANVMLDAEGRLKITDFGLSKLAGTAHPTSDSRPVGTAAYMSPEQAQGRSADRRSDIFSFGVTLFEMATGGLPFQGESAMAILYQIVHAPPPAVQSRRPDLPDRFAQIVEKALEKKPDRRYQRMEEVLADLEALQKTIEYTDAASQTPTASLMSLPRTRLSRRRLAGWIAAAAAGLALAVVGLPPVWKQIVQRLEWGRIQRAKHLAVLPFLSAGQDPDNQAFCDGLEETLSSTLTQLERFQGSLLVVPASEVRNQQIASPSAARKAFGVNLVISGSVQRSADEVRLHINLIDTASLRQVGARRIDARFADLSRLQDSVVAQAAELLEYQLEPQIRTALTAGGTRNAAAYDAYLQGRGYLYRHDKQGNLERAAGLLKQAVERDRDYALAHAALGEAYTETFRQTKELRWLAMAQSATERAVAINDRLAPAHINLGVVYAFTGRQEEAVSAFQRALQLDPINAQAYREMAGAYQSQSRLREAEATFQRAIEMRPADWLSHQALGIFYFAQQRYREAEPVFRKVIELTPDNHLGYRNLGGVYLALGRHAEAARMLERAIEVKPTAAAYSNLGTLYLFQGRYSEAVPMMEKAVEIGGSNYANDYRIWYNLGDAYLWAKVPAAKAPAAYQRAIQAAQRQLAINPKDAAVLSSVAVCWAKLGDKGKAYLQIGNALAVAPEDAAVGFKSVLVYELAGQREEALAALKKVLKAGYSIEEIRRDPALAQLRKDPRYAALAAARSVQSSPQGK